MYLGLNGATTINANLETDIRVAAEAGYQYLEVWAAKLRDFLERRSLGELRDLIAASGIKPLSINALENVTFQPAQKYQELQAECAWLCEQAGALGCRFVVVVPSPLPVGGASREEVKRESLEKLQSYLAIARRHGVGLAFEFLGEPNCSVPDLALCNEIVEEVDDPDLGLVLDAFHFYAGDSRLEDIPKVDPAKLFVVHMNDVEDLPKVSLRDEHRLLPGQGVIPLQQILSRVKAIGFDGVYSIELFRPEYWAWDPARLAREARRSMETVLLQSWAASHEGGDPR
jgi:2-keto-myo-inositol isomerase